MSKCGTEAVGGIHGPLCHCLLPASQAGKVTLVQGVEEGQGVLTNKGGEGELGFLPIRFAYMG